MDDIEKVLNKSIKINPQVLFDHANLEALTEYLLPHLIEIKVGVSQEVMPLMRVGMDEEIAIIGMDCRFTGGSESPDKYWELLFEGRDGLEDIPVERWDSSSMYVRRGGFIADADKFDAGFFNISPKEAKLLDPQQRLLLEVAEPIKLLCCCLLKLLYL